MSLILYFYLLLYFVVLEAMTVLNNKIILTRKQSVVLLFCFYSVNEINTKVFPIFAVNIIYFQ